MTEPSAFRACTNVMHDAGDCRAAGLPVSDWCAACLANETITPRPLSTAITIVAALRALKIDAHLLIDDLIPKVEFGEQIDNMHPWLMSFEFVAGHQACMIVDLAGDLLASTSGDVVAFVELCVDVNEAHSERPCSCTKPTFGDVERSPYCPVHGHEDVRSGAYESWDAAKRQQFDRELALVIGFD